MILYAAKSTGATLLAIALFATPLVLKYHVYRKQLVHTTPGDTIPLNKKLSTFWCEGIQLNSQTTFNAYQYDDAYPEIKEKYLQRTHAQQQITLPNRDHEYWGFHFLKGTVVSVSMCVRLSGAQMFFVQGSHNVIKCIDEHNFYWIAKGDSLEDESEEESDEQTSSISSSQGVVSNETDDLFQCSEALFHARLKSNYRCTSSISWLLSKKLVFVHEVNFTDFYYFIFSSNTYLDILPNEFFVEFVFDRTVYNFNTSSTKCVNVTECELPTPFLSDKSIFVELPAVNGTWNTVTLDSTCIPRKGIFFLFYVAFAIVIFICAFR